MAGELQLGGSTVATHTGSGASAVVTIDNGVKFPAGHVIQTVRSTLSSSSNITTSTTFAKVQNSLSEYFYATINNVLSNSKVLIQAIFTGRYTKGSNNAGGQFGLYRESTIILGESTLSEVSPYYEHINVTSTDYYHPQTIMFLDESPATGTNNYYLGYASYGNTSVQVIGHPPNFEMILMEIA